jgi:hypothetical protein
LTYICGPRLYEYNGVIIEMSACSGPWASNRNGDPYQRLPAKVKKAIDEWWMLPEEEQNKYRVGGGCVRL